MTNCVGIIGGGNLGVAIAEGLVKSGFIKPEHIIITRRNIAAIKHLEQQGIFISDNNNEAVAFANVIVLAVKPFQVAEVIERIKPYLTENHVLVSVVTGVTIEMLRNCVGNKVNLVRAMPNTAIAIQESMTCLCFDTISEERLNYVQEMFNQL